MRYLKKFNESLSLDLSNDDIEYIKDIISDFKEDNESFLLEKSIEINYYKSWSASTLSRKRKVVSIRSLIDTKKLGLFGNKKNGFYFIDVADLIIRIMSYLSLSEITMCIIYHSDSIGKKREFVTKNIDYFTDNSEFSKIDSLVILLD